MSVAWSEIRIRESPDQLLFWIYYSINDEQKLDRLPKNSGFEEAKLGEATKEERI